MFSRLLTLGVALGSVAIAPVTLAGDKHGYRYDRASYVQNGPAYDYARVISSEPIVRQVRVQTPQRECWTEDQYEEPPRPAHTGLAGPMILGGIIGGVIGSQFGHGDGRRAATLAGTLIGSSIGHDAGARRQAQNQPYEPRITSVERCGVRYIDSYEERIEGYNVEYEYAGQRQQTRLPYDPGERIRVRVAVAPAEDDYDS
jgi:uncharacterized protein YcfJ